MRHKCRAPNSTRAGTQAPLRGRLDFVLTCIFEVNYKWTNMKKGTEYELFVQSIYRAFLACDGIEVLHNSKFLGKSGASHQIDVSWNFEKAGVEHDVIVECKDRGRPTQKSEIAAFKTVLDDLEGRPVGLFVSKSGFQSGAIKLADHNGIRLLEIRSPIDSDWGDDEILEIHIDLQFKRREFNILNLRVEIPKETLFEGSISSMAERQTAKSSLQRLGPHLQGESGNSLGQLFPFLEQHDEELAAGCIQIFTFPPKTYVVLEGESVSRGLAVSCTYSFSCVESQDSLVFDLRDQVVAVVNDIVTNTQTRFDRNMRPSPKTPR